MRRFGVGLIAGAVFALGLGIGGMTNANTVIAFLNVAGDWDYRLGLVMLGGLLITTPAYRIFKKKDKPLLGGLSAIPHGGEVDTRLVLGGSLFGLGWGLGGYCPGPAVVSTVTGDPAVLTFVVSMAIGMVGHDRLIARLRNTETHKERERSAPA